MSLEKLRNDKQYFRDSVIDFLTQTIWSFRFGGLSSWIIINQMFLMQINQMGKIFLRMEEFLSNKYERFYNDHCK